MKILSLYLRNFSHIYSGLELTEISLDFSKSNKTINIIIGKMGSCKTVILGHLQPFSSFGTLDSRNQDPIILKEKDGLKIIVYQRGSDIYKITHRYQWIKDHHTVKSFITKNDLELNPNGNQSSFKSIIELEFGIDQDFLRLIRLGPNVSNLIDQKASERKAFVASMLSETEMYAMLYKKLNDELRTTNAQIKLITDKISSLISKNGDDVEDRIAFLGKDLNKMQSEVESLMRQLYALMGESQAILNGLTLGEYETKLENLITEKRYLEDKVDTFEKDIMSIRNSCESSDDVSRKLGALDNERLLITRRSSDIFHQLEEIDREIAQIQEQEKISQNREYLKSLKKEYSERLSLIEKYRAILVDFKISLTPSQIKSLIDLAETVSLHISEVVQYPRDAVRTIFKSDESVLGFAQKQIEMQNHRKIKLQRSLNNLQFVEKYTLDRILYIPPMCPTKSCPFYSTHPSVIQSDKKEKDAYKEEYNLINQSIKKCDQQIYYYSDFSVIFNKIKILKREWADIIRNLKPLGCVIDDNLYRVLTDLSKRVWYNYDGLIKILEQSEMREKFEEMVQKVTGMKAELASYELADGKSLNDKLHQLLDERVSLIDEAQRIERRLSDIGAEEEKLNKIYHLISTADVLRQENKENKNRISLISDEIISMKERGSKIYENEGEIRTLNSRIAETQGKISVTNRELSRLKSVSNDIKYSKEEFNGLLDNLEYLSLIAEAVSSNKGIPLVFVELFLADSKDTVNQLISDVFGDTIEIQDFKINDSEFRIPYTMNGILVDDISKASQGQRSIISLALSFALMRQGSSQYNIMLLDEMDGPLYNTDRNKFITVLYKQLQAIGAEQVFVISHNNTFDGHNVNIIMTTDEPVEKTNLISVMRVWDK